MDEQKLKTHIVSLCVSCRERGVAVLQYATSQDDKEYIAFIHLVERVLDITVGGKVKIGSTEWVLEEHQTDRRSDGAKIQLCLRRVDNIQNGMVTTDRPKTKAEWCEWAKARLQSAGVPLQPAQPSTIYQSHEVYSTDFEGMKEAWEKG